MQDVAHDRHVQPLEPAERLAHRVEIEQRLSRVLVLSVAGVHDMRFRYTRDELWSADLRMPDDDHVGVVGAERDRRVLQRLALVDRGAAGFDRHRVGGEPLRSELEARRRPCRRLVENVDHQPALEGRQFLHLSLEAPLEGAGGGEQPLDVVSRDVLDRDEVPPGRRGGRTQVLPHDADVSHRGSPPLRLE